MNSIFRRTRVVGAICHIGYIKSDLFAKYGTGKNNYVSNGLKKFCICRLVIKRSTERGTFC